MEEIKSPCVGICSYNLNGLCVGCYRTSEEITKWVDMPNEEKLETLANIEKRQDELSGD